MTTYKIQIVYDGKTFIVELNFDIGEDGHYIISFGNVYRCNLFGNPYLN